MAYWVIVREPVPTARGGMSTQKKILTFTHSKVRVVVKLAEIEGLTVARTVVNTTDKSLSRLCLGLYGEGAVGKTRFMGDAMASFVEAGKSVKFINMSGEDGYGSLAGYDLPDGTVETAETLLDVREICDEGPYDLLCLDTMALVSKLSVEAITKGVRSPVMTKEKNEWTDIHIIFERILRQHIKKAAPFQILATHMQRYENPVTGELRLSPDLEGKQATMFPKMVDMLAAMDASTNGKGVVTRRLIVRPMAKGTKDEPGYVTRQRLTRTIEQDVILPEGNGGWEHFINIVKEHM